MQIIVNDINYCIQVNSLDVNTDCVGRVINEYLKERVCMKYYSMNSNQWTLATHNTRILYYTVQYYKSHGSYHIASRMCYLR